MRLKPEKIERLARLIYEALEAHGEVTVTEPRDRVTQLIRAAIAEDLQAEDEIEEQARAMLEQYREEIRRKGASYDKMLQKAKQKIAQERKMVL
jgi:hypothetical protein